MVVVDQNQQQVRGDVMTNDCKVCCAAEFFEELVQGFWLNSRTFIELELGNIIHSMNHQLQWQTL